MIDTAKMTPIIGMEIHVELATKSKMFCGCPANHFGVEPNTQTCPVCLGMPGALPVPNRKAIEWTAMIGTALKSTIATQSKFDRKHYFYPDLPKGYQISQYDEPICSGGYIDTSTGRINITRVHLEEDTAKLQHITLDDKEATLIDFNRSSVPLVEIVTEPEIHSAEQAKEYAQKIQQIVRYLGVSDADMEKGSMRVEANISWGLNLGYKVEVKNINSFRFLEKAITYELNRQKALLEKGITPDQETRGYNESKSSTYSQRVKEEAADYRYFPEPDIPPLVLTPDQINDIKNKMPPLPVEVELLFTQKYHIRPDYAAIFSADKKRADFTIHCFELAKKTKLDLTAVANFLINKTTDLPSNPEAVIKLIETSSHRSSLSTADLEKAVQESINANKDVVAKYKSGKLGVIGALVGDVMRRTKGQADAKTTNELLLKRLGS